MSEVVVFDEALYPLAAVQRAVERYSTLARIRLAAEGGKISATIDDIDAEMADFLVDELCNDALHETISMQRSGDRTSDAGGAP